jgi:hypothetical protein
MVRAMRRTLVAVVIAGCGATRAPGPPRAWPVPAGFKSETIPFPLAFAPTVARDGAEELRFAPGFFDPAAPGYWSYAFVWRTRDAAAMDAPALGAALTAYFRGLIAAVDDQHAIPDRDAIVATAAPAGAGFALTAHVFDAFKTHQPLDLTGRADRLACGQGAVWRFVLAPAASAVRPELDALVAQAACDQPPLPVKP